MDRHRRFWLDSTSGIKSKSSAGRTFDRKDPVMPVSKQAQGEVGSIMERAFQVLGSRKDSPKSETVL